jgi:hypothetical protein
MQTKDPPRIVAGEKMGDAIFIEFDDGSSGLYSAPLLYAMLPQAEAVNSSDPLEDWEEEE